VPVIVLDHLSEAQKRALSFHVGLMARVAARREPEGSEAEQEFLIVTNRKLVQASEAFDKADEAEEFQAVGMLSERVVVALETKS
jgi:hypothetical protein